MEKYPRTGKTLGGFHITNSDGTDIQNAVNHIKDGGPFVESSDITYNGKLQNHGE